MRSRIPTEDELLLERRARALDYIASGESEDSQRQRALARGLARRMLVPGEARPATQ